MYPKRLFWVHFFLIRPRIERIYTNYMVSYELSNETGWQSIPGGTHTIVAHFRDGHEEKMSLVDFLVMGRKRNQVKRIDCYKEGEI